MKYALVTGGSRGIGKATSIVLAAMGYHVLINYRSNETEARETLKSIKAKGGSGSLLPFDVSDPVKIQEVLNAWQEANPDQYIEVLINNAGIRKDGLMMWMKDEDWNEVMKTNLDSVFYTTRTLLSKMLSKRYGRIINVVSLSGITGLPGQYNYSSAKAGVIGGTKSLAQEVAKRGVTVNAVAPGFIRTDMTEDLPENEVKNIIPMKRFGTAEEVADLIGFLASEKAGYITGEVISIDGGLPS